MGKCLKMRRDGVRAWLLSDAETGLDVGGIQYAHDANGDHYQPWLIVKGARRNIGKPLPQLAMAACEVDQAFAQWCNS